MQMQKQKTRPRRKCSDAGSASLRSTGRRDVRPSPLLPSGVGAKCEGWAKVGHIFLGEPSQVDEWVEEVQRPMSCTFANSQLGESSRPAAP